MRFTRRQDTARPPDEQPHRCAYRAGVERLLAGLPQAGLVDRNWVMAQLGGKQVPEPDADPVTGCRSVTPQ